jgi:hypothetical protein
MHDVARMHVIETLFYFIFRVKGKGYGSVRVRVLDRVMVRVTVRDFWRC